MMLPLVLITSLAGLIAADGFLDDCPVDAELRFGRDRVVDILHAFYKDLVFVRASTAARQVAREYSDLARQMFSGYELDADPSLDELYRYFARVVYLLRSNRVKEAEGVLKSQIFYDDVHRGRDSTYLKYLQAETNRLLGNNEEAASCVLSAYLRRADYDGIAVNDLARLDGLVALQRVSQFNLDLDRSYGLIRSPDYKLLSLLHLLVGAEIGPLSEVRWTILDRLYNTDPSVGQLLMAGISAASEPSTDMHRSDRLLDELNVQSVSNSSVEGILCELARKLQVLGVSRRDETPADHSEVIDQLRQMDPSFADELASMVVANVEPDFDQAQRNAREIWTHMWCRSPQNDREFQEIFACYFSVELNRQLGNVCNLWTLSDLHEDLASLKYSRRTFEGVSLGKLVELEGKVVLLWLKCFHERVKLAYGLSGGEDDRQREQRRAEFGGDCERVLPRSVLMERL